MSISANFTAQYYVQQILCCRMMPHSRDVTEPANIRIRRMRISCAESVGFGCGCGFVARSKLPATTVTIIQLSYVKLSSCK